ncbi:MAG: transcription antitermination factor NusB [Alphaproteobacteria bacterium]|nr:transcription antitermination factor NusB [Alphaproteobacteria bacterium]
MTAKNEVNSGKGRYSGASARGAARLMAVQALYQIEIRGGTAESTVTEFLKHRTEMVDEETDTKVRLEADKALFADLVRGVDRECEMIESTLDGCLDGGTTTQRLEPLLRAIMKAGVFELQTRSDIPAKVTISEYVHLTDAFFDSREPGLVNAVLDRLARVLREDETSKRDTTGDGAAS